MGHHALVAYEQPDGTYNVHNAPFGAFALHLKHDITEATPFGGSIRETTDGNDLLADYLDRIQYDVKRVIDDEELERPAVDTAPLVLNESLETILAEWYDFLKSEAFYVVSPTFDVAAYRPMWFGMQYDSESVVDGTTIGNGALRNVRFYDVTRSNDGEIQGEFSALKDIAGDLIDRGVFTHEDAAQYMQEKLAEWAPAEDELFIVTPGQAVE